MDLPQSPGRPNLLQREVLLGYKLAARESSALDNSKRGIAVQYTSTVAGNPFAVLTAIVAPAILTNASSVLALGTSNRLARGVDRTRVVWAELAALDHGSPDYQLWATQLPPLHERAQLLVRALRFFYAGLGLFAASALVSVVGSIGAYYGQALLFEIGASLGILTGASAVLALSSGCFLMVRETQLAVRYLAEEAHLRAIRGKIPAGEA
jgi:Protein of unknown function (DUF2721)